MAWRPRAVSLSSGGVLLNAQLGVLATLMEAGLLDSVREWHGCSCGAIAATLCAIGVTPSWIRKFIRVLRMEIVGAPQDECIANYFQVWGVTDGTGAIEYFCKIMDTWHPGSSAWTFADLARECPHTSLTVIATNVSKQRLARFSVATTPQVRLVDAVRASCGVPLYFTPWLDPSGDMYCDGAVIEYYPWSYLTDRDNTLVIACHGEPFRGTGTVSSIPNYIGALLRCARRYPAHPRNWIAINRPDVSLLDFKMTEEERVSLFETGVQAARGWMLWRERCAALTDSAPTTAQTLKQSAHPGTLSSDHPSPDRMWDSHQSGSPQLTAYPSRDSRSASSLPSRRWSL